MYRRNKENVNMPGFRPNMTHKDTREQLYGESNVANNFAQGIINPIARSVNTAGSFGAKAVAIPVITADLIKESVAGTNQSYQQKLNKYNAFLDRAMLGKKGGLFNAGTHVNTVEELDDPKKMAGTILVTGSDLASFVPLGKAASAGAKGTTSAAKVLLREGATNAAINTASSVGDQLNRTGTVDPLATAIGAASGFVAPVPFYAGGRVTGNVAGKVASKLGLGSSAVNKQIRQWLSAETSPTAIKSILETGFGVPADTVDNIANYVAGETNQRP